jgi:hypothetical protein
LNVQRSTVLGNSAFFDGGGIVGLNGDVVVTDSTISGNTTNEGGGGILAYIGDLTVTGSTISGNSAKFNGGGIEIVVGVLQVAHSTIADNRADTDINLVGQGGGIAADAASTVQLNHAIVANNRRGNVDNDLFSGVSVLANYSLVETIAGVTLVGSGNVTGLDPLLGPLAGNGGPTFTLALLPGSPALDAGDPAAVAGMGGVPVFDQRGMPWSRVAGGRIDIGAVESQANPLAGDYNFNGVVDAADYSVWRDTLGSTNDLRADGTSATTPGMPDGVVDELDYAFWKANFGNTLAMGGGGLAVELVAHSNSVTAQQPTADPEAGYPAGVGSVVVSGVSLPFGMVNTTNKSPADPEAGYPAGAVGRESVAVPRLDDALLAWLAQRGGTDAVEDRDGLDAPIADETSDSAGGIFDEVFAELDCGL